MPKLVVAITSAAKTEASQYYSFYRTRVLNQGYTIEEIIVSGGLPSTLKSQIWAKNPSAILLVGNIPAAWWDEAPSGEGTSVYPCDLFYSNRYGTWNLVPGYNDRYGSITGDKHATVPCGRVIGNYNKNAVNYIFRSIIGGRDRLNTPYTTNVCREIRAISGGSCRVFTGIYSSICSQCPVTKSQYLSYIATSPCRIWLHLDAHSAPTTHVLCNSEYIQLSNIENPGTDYNKIPIGLYLSACHACRFSENNLGSGYFKNSFTVSVIGATDSVYDFVYLLGTRQTFYQDTKTMFAGEAFRRLQNKVLDDSRGYLGAQAMVLLGDPIFKITK